MDYSGYYEFPFPKALSGNDANVKNFFFSLPDKDQLMLLNGCTSYENFHDRVVQRMEAGARPNQTASGL